MDISVGDGTSTLLEEMRHHRFQQSYMIISDGSKMELLIQHQSEFPIKIREVILLAANAPERTPVWFVAEVYNALKAMLLCKPEKEDTENKTNGIPLVLWNGLDSAVDTEEEVEAAVRFFPEVLREENDNLHPVYWLASCLKAIPFIPLLAELGRKFHMFREHEQYYGQVLLIELFGNYRIREFWPNKFDDEFSRELDEVCHSVLVRLEKKGFVTFCGYADMVLYATTPLCTEKRLRLVIGFDPTILTRSSTGFDTGTLLYSFLDELEDCNGADLKRFQVLFELGMCYYPDSIGFLFSREDVCPNDESDDKSDDESDDECTSERDNTHPFSMACVLFGKENVTELVDEIILKSTRGRPLAIENFVFAAATNPNIAVDGLYFLLRRDPTAFVPSIPRASGADHSCD